MKLSTFALLSCVGLALITGCSVSGRLPCGLHPAASQAMLSLVYPIDNATAVPDSPQAIVVQQDFSGGTFSGLQLVLTPPSGPPVIANVGPVPSPLPTPNSSPSPNAALIAFSVPTLAPATTYVASFKGTVTFPTVDCGPVTDGLSGGGSFTTQ